MGVGDTGVGGAGGPPQAADSSAMMSRQHQRSISVSPSLSFACVPLASAQLLCEGPAKAEAGDVRPGDQRSRLEAGAPSVLHIG